MSRASDKAVLPIYRLYLLRAMFALIGLWQGYLTWSAILHRSHPWIFWHGVATSLMGALTLLCLLGIRYPVKMMALLFFEFIWKLIWVLSAWLPLWMAHRVDADTARNFFGIFAGVVVVPFLLPWGYIWKHYVIAPGDRWK